MHWFSTLSLRSKLLGAFGLVLLVMAGGGAFGAYRLSSTTDGFNALISQTIATRTAVMVINTAFISRHKVLKDAYLFNTNAATVATTEDAVAGFDSQVTTGLSALAANTNLQPAEQKLVQDATHAYTNYQTASTRRYSESEGGR